MLVIEKYKDEIKEILTDRSVYSALILINNKLLDGEIGTPKDLLLKLLEEYKEPIKVSRYELETLKLLFERGYLYITRDSKNKYVGFHKVVPEFYDGKYSKKIDAEYSLNDTFNFIKEETIYKIEEVLSNCEVVKDA